MNAKYHQVKIKEVKIPAECYVLAKCSVHFSDQDHGTSIDADLILSINPENVGAELNICGCIAPTTDEAFLKLADWLEQFAVGLRKKPKQSLSIPIFNC